jgi:hypothetical protein
MARLSQVSVHFFPDQTSGEWSLRRNLSTRSRASPVIQCGSSTMARAALFAVSRMESFSYPLNAFFTSGLFACNAPIDSAGPSLDLPGNSRVGTVAR